MAKKLRFQWSHFCLEMDSCDGGDQCMSYDGFQWSHFCLEMDSRNSEQVS